MRSSIILSTAFAVANAATVHEHVIDAEQAASDALNNAASRIVPHWKRAGTSQTVGFSNPTSVATLGGHGNCIQGIIPVTASASNTKLNYAGPTNELDLTNLAVEYVQVNSTLGSTILGATNTVSGTYNISSKICFPNVTTSASNKLPLQFLIHGVGFDKNYWDFYSTQYSYADYMAKAGYTTFSFDRLGTGLSDHPDPLQIVQSTLEVSIAHSLIGMLRTGKISNTKFPKIIGVGHSFGSFQINGITKSYPSDLDAAVLTGMSLSQAGVPNFISALNLDIAAKNQPSRFSGLPNSYTVSSTQISNQFAFFRYPNFDSAVLAAAEAAKGTFALGELFTLGAVVGPANSFTGPVDVVLGEADLPFCQGNCNLPSNQATQLCQTFYPNSKAQQSYLMAGAGHAVNMHYNSTAAYAHISSFLNSNGF